MFLFSAKKSLRPTGERIHAASAQAAACFVDPVIQRALFSNRLLLFVAGPHTHTHTKRDSERVGQKQKAQPGHTDGRD